MERGKMSSSGRGGKSKAPQHPQDIFALGTKSTVVVSRDAEKRNIHKPSTSGVERKRETPGFGTQPPNKRARIGSPAEAVGGTSLEVDPVDLVPNVLQALDTHNSDKLLGLLTGSIRLLKSQRSKPDPILCMGLLYLTKIRPNMFAHETVTNTLCTLLKREQGAAFKNKGNPLVFVLACNMLYAGHRESNNWPDIFIKVYIEDALNERWWVDCSWCKCLVENIITAFGTKQPPSHLIPTDNTLGTMSPSGSGSPLMGSGEDETDNTELEYSVFPRYSSSYEAVEGLVLEAIKDQIQRRSAAPDAIGKGFLKLLAATCGFPEIRMISAARLEGWLNSGKLWRAAQELLAHVCVNCAASGASAARDHEVLAQLARMRLKTKPLQAAYQACLREMTADSPQLLRSVVTHTVYNELSNVRSPNNTGVLAALAAAAPAAAAQALGDTLLELAARGDEWARPLRALCREVTRALRADAAAALPALARALAAPPDAAAEARERSFAALADLQACLCLLAAAHVRPDPQQLVAQLQAQALGWLLDTAEPCYRPSRQDFQLALNKIMFVESAEMYSKVDNWPPESERALLHRVCCEAPLPQNNLLRIIFIGLSKEIPVSPSEVFELVETLVRRACALPPEDNPLQVDKLEVAEYIFQLVQFAPPDNVSLPAGYAPPPLAISSLYWRGWLLLVMLAAHNPHTFAERAATTYPTLRALIETCITNKPSVEWVSGGSGEAEERAAILQLEAHLAAAASAKAPVTEASSRLLSQLCALEPLGPARRPPAAVLDALAALAQQLRLGALLCRQPALLVALVERHGTRRAMPWLAGLLRGAALQLSVLPVQCLCELLAAGGGEARAPELRAHLRRTLAAPAAARAVLQYYCARLAHAARSTRAQAARGLRLVLAHDDQLADHDYTKDVSPDEWLGLLWSLRQWPAVRHEVSARIRAACLVECVPQHVHAYIDFLAQYVNAHPEDDHSELVLDLSQVVMERTAVMARVVGGDAPAAPHHHRALHALTTILYHHLQKVRSGAEGEGAGGSGGGGEGEGGAWAGERIALQWAPGRVSDMSLLVVHAHLKLLCLGPSMFDTEQRMYSWLVSVWVGAEAPLAPGGAEALLPDWLRLQLVRSARPALLAAALRGLPAHKLALFIQTFGMPVPAMSALLAALDASPAGAVCRVGVERGYMWQLLRVQRARGATGGEAFAAALGLQPLTYPPDDNLFAESPPPLEADEEWEMEVEARPPEPGAAAALLAAVLGPEPPPAAHADFVDLIQLITAEAASPAGAPYTRRVVAALPQLAAALAARPAPAAALMRALLPHTDHRLAQLANSILSSSKVVLSPLREALAAHVSAHAHEIKHMELGHNATKEELVALLESATASSLEEIGNNMIETQHPRLLVDVITQILENHQEEKYETKVKSEDGSELAAHVFSSRGRGCGLLLDWLAELQPETIPDRQLRLMFGRGGCGWRPLLVAGVAHRASWRALHATIDKLLTPDSGWWCTSVVQFLQTLTWSERVWQGRDRSARKHRHHPDTLTLTYTQMEVLIRYIAEEGRAAGRGAAGAGAECAALEARLPLVLRCAASTPLLLAAALAAAAHDDTLLTLLYMKVPKIRQLLVSCEARPAAGAPLPRGRRGGTAATDRVSHAVLTALPHHNQHNKDLSQKAWRLEGGVRAVWARVGGAGARALPLAGALLRGALPPAAKHHQYLLSPVEALPDAELFHSDNSSEIHSILECFILICCGGGGGGGSSLAHRVGALLRRYVCARPQLAQQLLNKHQHLLASNPALSGLVGAEVALPSSASPPPHALLTLQRNADEPAALLYALQELESWGVRRGGGWGGAGGAGGVLRALGPLAAHASPALRAAALGLLARLLPAAPDPMPGVRAILECLDSDLPEVAQSAVDKLPDLIVGMQEHAARVLMKVFELGVKSRVPVDACLAKCVATINMQRGC